MVNESVDGQITDRYRHILESRVSFLSIRDNESQFSDYTEKRPFAGSIRGLNVSLNLSSYHMTTATHS